MATTVIILVLIEDEIIWILIDSIVSQVHEQIVNVVICRRYVFFSRESSESFLVDEDSKWIDSIDETVNSQIEFKTVYQIRFSDVSLSYILLSLLHFKVFKLSNQVDSPSLAEMHRLYYEGLSFLLISRELILKVIDFGREYPSLRKHIEVILENL